MMVSDRLFLGVERKFKSVVRLCIVNFVFIFSWLVFVIGSFVVL